MLLFMARQFGTGLNISPKIFGPRLKSPDIRSSLVRSQPHMWGTVGFRFGSFKSLQTTISNHKYDTKTKATTNTKSLTMDPNLKPTKLEYFDDMLKLQSSATLLSSFQAEDGRQVMILESTIFHAQGGGQPSDAGVISNAKFKFIVQDVRLKDKIVFHYGIFENSDNGAMELEHLKGEVASLCVDESRRKLNSRLHSAGHLLDVCMTNVGLGHLEPTKGYHFPDGPFVEYRGTVPQNVLEQKQRDLELEANKLISSGGKVYVSIVPYDQACELCGGCLPDYIPKESTPRIVKFGENPGCPCGGTHVQDIADIGSVKVSQIRTKKGATKVFYVIES